MSRAIWKGSIAFGLVNVPVELHSAEDSDEISFHQLDKHDFSPVGYKRINKTTGKEVAWGDIVRGFEVGKGNYVVLTDAELEAAHPEATHTIDLVNFVEQSEIDPLQYDKPYYLTPSKTGAKAYSLLRETLNKKQCVGIAKIVIRTRQHLAAIIPREDVLTLVMLRFASEVRQTKDLDLPHGKGGAVTPREIAMASDLVDSMTVAWKPDDYSDEYRDQILALVDEKEKAGKVNEIAPHVPAPKAKAPKKVVDLMALLKKSVEANANRPAKQHSKAKVAPKKHAPKRRAG